MVGRSLTFAAVLALCVSQSMHATLSLAAIKGDIVARINKSPLSHLSTIVSGFLIPLVQKRLANVVPDGAIPGLQTRVKDLVNAGLASTVAAGCAVLHSPESFASQFEKAVLGEVGHLGVQELIQKLGLNDLLTSDEKDLYNKFGAGYVKNALSVIVAHVLAEVKGLFGSFGSSAPAA
jgi:hypothetical protein